jgi:hypothetical protein
MKISEVIQGIFLAAITGLVALMFDSMNDLAGEIRAQSILVTRNTRDITGLEDKIDRIDTKTVLNRVVIAELEAQCRRWIDDAKNNKKPR